MSSRHGAQVRAFSVDGARGNPAFVFATGPDEHSDEHACIAMAARRHSEVTWVRRVPGQAGIALRFFTAGGEIAFCGHGTLAAAAWLAERHGAGPELRFEIGGTSWPVTRDAGGRWSYPQEAAGFQAVNLGRAQDRARDLADVERALGLPAGRLVDESADEQAGEQTGASPREQKNAFLPRARGVKLVRSAGALREKILLEVPDSSVLSAIAMNAASAAARDALCERLQATGLYVFAIVREAGAPRIRARHFPLHAGEHEDMATGGIAPTVVRYAAFDDPGPDVVIEQGGPDCGHSRIVVSRSASGAAHRVAGECVVGVDEAITGTLVTQANTL